MLNLGETNVCPAIGTAITIINNMKSVFWEYAVSGVTSQLDTNQTPFCQLLHVCEREAKSHNLKHTLTINTPHMFQQNLLQ